MTDELKNQVQLPTERGGCQMLMPTTMLHAARAADLIEVGPHIRQVVTEWGHDVEAAKEVDGVAEVVADGFLISLAEQRVTHRSGGEEIRLIFGLISPTKQRGGVSSHAHVVSGGHAVELQLVQHMLAEHVEFNV